MLIPEEVEKLRHYIEDYARTKFDPEEQFSAHLIKDVLMAFQEELLVEIQRDLDEPDQSLNQIRRQLIEEVAVQVGYEFLERMNKEEQEDEHPDSAPAPLDARELDLLSRSYSISVGDKVYCFYPSHLEEENGQCHLTLEFCEESALSTWGFTPETLEFSGPLSDDGTTFHFRFMDQPMACILPWGLFRWLPPYDPSKIVPMSSSIAVVDNTLVRFSKPLALANLTPHALALACKEDEEYLYWSIPDYSFSCLEFELPEMFAVDDFSRLQDHMSRYCEDYLDQVCYQPGIHPIVKLDQNYTRTPVLPEE